MKIRSGTIGKGTLPVLAAAFLCTGTQSQIIEGGYTCGIGTFSRTHNFSLDITQTAGTCTLPVEYAQWFDMSVDVDLAASFATIKCVDFSMWGTTNIADQLITVRVFQDLTPLSSSIACDLQITGYDGANEPGPELAGSLLLGEDETFIPIGVDPTMGPRLNGDFSVEFTGPQGGGILLEPDIAIYVVVAHAGESIVQFGNNNLGQLGDGTTGAPGGNTGGPEQSWIRPFNCSVGASLCTQTGDWIKANLYYGANQDHVLQIHLDRFDTRDPLILTFDCRQDIAPFTFDPDLNLNIIEGNGQVDVVDLLALLGSWGANTPPRPVGDIAPCPDPGIDCFGNNATDVVDLLSLLSAWGPCPNLVTDCETTLAEGNIVGQVGEGTFLWAMNAGSIDTAVARPETDIDPDTLGGVGACGWDNYLVTYAAGGTFNGFIWGDVFGVYAGNASPPDPATVGADVWFHYTASCNGRAFISATSNCVGSDVLDTILEVYDGAACPISFTESLFCNDSDLDPAGCGDFGAIDFAILVGEEFLIRIAGWLGETGTGSLNISCVDNSDCDTALPISINGDSVSASTVGASIDPDAPNCPISLDAGGRWFSVIGNGTTLTASTCQTAAVEDAGGIPLYDSEISIFCGTNGEICADLECIAGSLEGDCNLHDEVSWCSIVGQEYYILVHGNGAVTDPPFTSEGFFILDVTSAFEVCATGEPCGVTRPSNDKCENATVMLPGPLVETPPDSGIFVSISSTPTAGRDNNVNALTDGPDLQLTGCAALGFVTRDVWYRYTPEFTSNVVISTCAAPFVNVDTTLEVFLASEAECPPVDSAGLLTCNNDGGAGCIAGSSRTSSIVVFAGQELLIRLGANGGDKQGFYTMVITATAIVSLCSDPLEWDDPCPPGSLREGGGDGELLLAAVPYSTLDISGIAGGGRFAAGDTVEGVTSGATGVIIALQTIAGVDILMLDTVAGTFSASETVTNGDPLAPDILTDATATADAVNDFVTTGDITNGGCNVCAPGPADFDSLVPDLSTDLLPVDLVVCGQISTYVSDADLDCVDGLDGFSYQLRDTDWYTLTIPAVDDVFGLPSLGATVTLTFASEFSASFGITEATCGASPADPVPFLASGINGGLCSESTLVANLDAGDYYVVVTSGSVIGFAVGATHEGHDYHMTIAPLEGGTPLPVVNDECAGALPIGINSTTIVDQRNGATQNESASCIPTRHFGSVWYSVVAGADATATVQTCVALSNADSSLIAYSGTCGALTEIGCSEDAAACFGFNSRMSLAGLINGDTYYISVGAWEPAEVGIYQLDITSP